MRAAKVRAVHSPALELLPNIALITVLYVGGHRVLDGQLTLGDLVSFNVYLALLVGPLRMLGNLVAQVQRAVAAGGRIHEVLVADPAIVDLPQAKPLGPGGGELRFEDVSFSYRDGRRVLDHLDLTIEAGTSVALVGSTASGKTTLARLVPRFYEVSGGRILLDGQDVRDVRLQGLRRSVATVFEETFLFSDTIGANIAFAEPGARREQVEHAARLAGAASASASPSPGPCSPTRGSSSSTMRPRPSIPRRSTRSGTR
jgi:ATP-binding cassette subfamily B protein